MTSWLLYMSIVMDALFLCVLFWAAIADMKRREIPDAAVIVIVILGVTETILRAAIIDHLLGLALTIPVIIPGLLGHIGGGDYKLLLGTGLYLGLSQSLLAVVLSLPAAICVAVYLLTRKKTLKGIRIPLAPLIAFSCAESIIFKWITIF